MVKTSIIVPVYNTAPYLKDCFDSIFNQTQKEIEVIAINDGSTDDSLNILKEIQKAHPELIIVSQENKKQGAARNKGIEMAVGEFIYFMDSDDCLNPTALNQCYRCAKENNLDMVMFDAETFGDVEHDIQYYDRSQIIKEPNLVLSGMEFANKYWTERFVPSPVLLYTSTHFIKEYALKFPEGIYYEDNDFYCKAIAFAKRVMYVPQILYRRRFREGSTMTSVFDLNHARDFLAMIQFVYDIECHAEMRTVINEMVLKFLNNLYGRCLENNLLSDYLFAHDFFDRSLSIFGGVIENINSYQRIEFLDKLVKASPDTIFSTEIKQKIKKKKQEEMKKIFSDIPFRSKKANLGIYGTGKSTERFLEEYQKYVGNIEAELIFINSNAVIKGQTYKGSRLIHVDDIVDFRFDCIMVSSIKYEKEIYETLLKKYGNQYRIVRLFADLKYIW